MQNKTLTHLKFSGSEKRQHRQFHKAVASLGVETGIGTKRDKHGVQIAGAQFLKEVQEQVT